MNVKDKVLQLDGKTNSVYDFTLHLAVPTLEKVRNEVDVDLIEFNGTEVTARADLKMNALRAKNLLMASRTRNSANDIEYLIATNEEYRNDFILYVCNFVYDIIYNGLMDKLNNTVDTDNFMANLTFNSFLFLKGSTLKNNSVASLKYDYRVGY